MLLHGNLMFWRQFEDIIPLLEKDFMAYAVSFDRFDGTGTTNLYNGVGQADKLAEYVCAECGWRLDMLFAESIGCGPAVFLKSSPKVQVDHMILSGPEYLDFGIMNKPLLKIMPQNQYKTAHEKSMPAWVLKLMGQTERGNADHDELYSGQYQPGISPRHMEAGLYLYRSDFPVQPDANVACWYGEKEGHMKKAVQRLKKAYPKFTVCCFNGFRHGDIINPPELLVK